MLLPGVLVLALGISASGQQPENPPPPPAQSNATQNATPQIPATTQDEAPPAAAPGNPSVSPSLGSTAPGAITEEQLKQLLVGKDLFLRGGYLGDSISFNENGRLEGHAPSGSYTLCAVRIEKVRVEKRKVELLGARYGLHFLGALPYEDPTKAMDRVRITPKKKVLRISIDREEVVKPKKAKAPKPPEGKAAKGTADAEAKAVAKPAPEPVEASEAVQPKAESSAATDAEKPASSKGGATTTTSPAHASRVLLDALGNIFATGLDDKMLEAMPTFWRLYYQAAAAKTDYRPSDPGVFRQTNVDTKAKLLTNFEPGSNEYAQANGVAGMALYHVVIGADGKPGEIAVARPIGFGLDESAVDSILKASFAPAIKDGKPVPVLLDLVVQFRIYSKRTAVTGEPEAPEKAAARKTPGPYSIQHP